jgi:hypothetical protein
MNSGLLEARELAERMMRVLRERGTASLLEEFARERHEEWQWLLGAGRSVRALPSAAPWVRQNAARILACLPASGDDVEPLLAQVGLAAS